MLKFQFTYIFINSTALAAHFPIQLLPSCNCAQSRKDCYSDLLSTASSSDFWDTFTLNRAKQSSPYALHSQMYYLLQSTSVRNISKKHTFIKLLLLFSKYATVNKK